MTAFVMLTVVTLTFAFRTAPKAAVLTDSYFSWNGSAWVAADPSVIGDCENENFYCALQVPAAGIDETQVNAAFNNATLPALGEDHDYTIELVIEREGQAPLPVTATVYEKDTQ